MVGLYHTIHLFIYPTTAALPFFPDLCFISTSFHASLSLTLYYFLFNIIPHLSIPCLTPSSIHVSILDSFPPSCIYSFIQLQWSPKMNWGKKKERQRKKLITYRAESFALSPEALPTTLATNTLIHYTAILQTHTPLGHLPANFMPISIKGAHYLVVFRTWRTTLHWHKDCILAL